MSRQILVCDDEPHIVRAISLKLTRAGFDSKSVTDVESCWRLLKRAEAPALLIIDRSFPTGADGVELVRWIRQDATLAELPIFMLFANQTELSEQQSLIAELKLAAAISKPFSPSELLESVGLLLGNGLEAAVAVH